MPRQYVPSPLSIRYDASAGADTVTSEPPAAFFIVITNGGSIWSTSASVTADSAVTQPFGFASVGSKLAEPNSAWYPDDASMTLTAAAYTGVVGTNTDVPVSIVQSERSSADAEPDTEALPTSAPVRLTE